MRNYTISVTFHWARCGLLVIQLSVIYYFDICEIIDKIIGLVIFKIQGDTKKRELLKTPTKIEEIQQKKIIDRN